MRRIRRSTRFKKDFKRLKSNSNDAKNLNNRFKTALDYLCQDKSLPKSFRDHTLVGNWKGFRECHLRPDLILIYRLKNDGEMLELARIGSHSELFG